LFCPRRWRWRRSEEVEEKEERFNSTPSKLFRYLFPGKKTGFEAEGLLNLE